MKPIIRNYKLINQNINKDTVIVCISDIHFSNRIENIKNNTIIDEITKVKPNYICIPGDFIDSSKVLLKKDNRIKIINFFKKLSNIAPIIISFGNHDYHPYKNIYKIKSRKITDFFKTLNNINNIYLLNNKILKLDNITFIGYSQSKDYYYGKQINNKEYMIKEFNKYFKKSSKNYSILLCHSPIHVLDNEVLENTIIKNTNLILSGHMHNGLVPPFLEKIWKSNKGLITPSKKIFPFANTTRGLINKNNKNLIISGGITKIQDSAFKLLYPLNYFFPMHIEVITLKKGSD